MAYMITTVDNPYDPRTDFEAWAMWDEGQGYKTSSYLARLVADAEGFPEAVRDKQIEDAIDEIIEMHNGQIYKKLKIDDENVQPQAPSAA